MTIEELLDCDAEKLKSFTDEQLLEWFKQYLPTTRPELAPKPQAKTATKRKVHESAIDRKTKQMKFDMAADMARKLGIDLDFDE